MFNTQRIPVTVYRSTDTAAPQLSIAAGSIKTVLKACLTQGYGGKQPLGWEMPFESGNAACWRSRHDQSTGHVLSVNANNTYADVAGYGTAVSATDGGNPFAKGRWPFASNNRRSGVMSLPWVLVGHARAFMLVILDDGGQRNFCPSLYFGDFATLAAADAGNCILRHNGYGRNLTATTTTNYDSAVGGQFAKNHTGDTPVNYIEICKADNYTCTYPNPISNGFTADDVYLAEQAGGNSSHYALRGLLGGIWRIAESIPRANGNSPLETLIPYGTVYGNLGDGDSYMYVRTSDASASGNRPEHLINLTAWEL